MENDTTQKTNENQELEHLRQLILGVNNQRIRDVIEKDAREVVSNILAEALHDRQSTDGTISQVLAPLIEKTVEHSITSRKEQFISYLYPLMGSLVRKSVSAFAVSLMEQTNQLLESSFTLKGLQWRVNAWKSGVTYAQYAVSQTFSFRVEQVLLIHSETGMLLNMVVRDQAQSADGDMVSGMLTAINDFVSDSFSQNKDANKQNLDEIKTDGFTLLIKQGPQAMLVAAITGNAPENISDALQLSLENIHKIYADELQNFKGDSFLFENTEQQLTQCLVEQQKESVQKTKRKPWLAIVVLLFLLSCGTFFIIKQWQLESKIQNIAQLPEVPGIVLLHVDSCNKNICLELLRDPLAISVNSWLQTIDLSKTNIKIIERSYQSLDRQLIFNRLELLAKKFPELTFNKVKVTYDGMLTNHRFEQLKDFINHLPGISHINIDTLLSGVDISKIAGSDLKLRALLLNQYIMDIERTSINFDFNESTVTALAEIELKELSEKISSTIKLSNTLDYDIKILIIGSSDLTGSKNYNQKLSTKRAQSVKNSLIMYGVDKNRIESIGLGVISSDGDTRQVLFSIIKVATKHNSPIPTN